MARTPEKTPNKALNNIEKEKLVDFRKILAIMEKNFIVLKRDKVRWIFLLAFPILMIVIFGYVSGNMPKHISTALINYDNSPLSLAVQQEISNSQTFAIRHIVSTEGEGKKLLDKGDVRVIIEIPSHLEEDINNGIQTGITVIVDESDSSVAGTVQQTLNAIVSKVSAKISLQKIVGFQQSVAAAAQKLQAYNSMQINQYGLIAASLAPVEAELLQSKKLTDSYADAIINSLASPELSIPSVYGNENAINTNHTLIFQPPGFEAAQAQIAVLQQSSGLAGAAAGNVHAAASLALQADQKAKALQDYQSYEQNVAKPMSEIQVFTYANANNILRPLVYEAKPAYGTGKRAVDFLIPSIIALTIFQGAVMGMGRAVAGEKREGSLTRVFLTPTSNTTIITGTLLFYIIFELLRSSFLILISILLFNIKIEGSLLAIGFILIIYAGISTALGMILSSIVKTEQQFMAIAMPFTMPTIFLSGAFFPLQAMPKFMQVLAQFMPVTYGGDALRGVMIKGFSLSLVAYPVAILFAFFALMLIILLMVFKRNIE
jgi:ABC-type multidrug transport system permease subunit